jgi:predicted N-acetyltransferase YhbS
VNIRPESPHDYGAVAELHIQAFGKRTAEALIVSLLRHRDDFTPELSLVAESEGRIVAHALFSPYTVQLLGNPLRAVNLAPLAVHPDHQKQRIGEALIQEGHQVARSNGYTLSFLLGHPEYYPRFGYKTGVYGEASLALQNTMPDHILSKRAITPADIPALQKLGQEQEAGVDFALAPSSSLLDWVSPNPLIESAVYTVGEKVVGYTRIHQQEPFKPRVFLATDAVVAHQIIADFAGTTDIISLPLHPYSKLAPGLGNAQVHPWNAAMACGLTSDSPFDAFYHALTENRRLPGRVIWPVAFDLA